jgi:hypothetical protein
VRTSRAGAGGLTITGYQGEASLILPGRVRIENNTASTADYAITLPATVTTLDIKVGPTRLPVVDLLQAGEHTIDLARVR